MLKFRPISSREAAFRFLVTISAGLAGIGFVSNWRRFTFLPCFFRSWTHLPCPLCGMTRSFAAMLQLDLSTALKSHPLGPFAFIAVAATMATIALSACFRLQPILQPPFHLPLRWITLLFLLVWIFRLFHIIQITK